MAFTVGIGWFRLGTHGELTVSKELINRVGDPKMGEFSFLNQSHLLGSWAFRNRSPIMLSIRLRNQFNITLAGSWQMRNTLVEAKLGSWQILNKLEGEEVLIITVDPDENLYLASRNLHKVYVCDVNEVDPASLVGFDKVLITADALVKLEERLA